MFGSLIMASFCSLADELFSGGVLFTSFSRFMVFGFYFKMVNRGKINTEQTLKEYNKVITTILQQIHNPKLPTLHLEGIMLVIMTVVIIILMDKEIHTIQIIIQAMTLILQENTKAEICINKIMKYDRFNKFYNKQY